MILVECKGFGTSRKGRTTLGKSVFNLAKVGVVGSNPIARSKFSNNLDKLRTKPSCPLSAECPRNVFASRSGHDESLETVVVGQREGHEHSQAQFSNNGCASKNAVRERFVAPATRRGCRDRGERPAHPSNLVVAQVNANWRVVDDPLQWILQRRKGKPRTRNSGWRDRSFCRKRHALLGCISRHCGEIDAGALFTLEALPGYHPDWERKIHSPNLDVRRTSRAQVNEQAEPLASQASEACED